jgi:DNA helicase II / ATP-dependent DNA helicase PcrA
MTAPLSLLNGPQFQAVTHPGGPLLVLAGAGTGKTRVLAHRLAWLLDHGVPPDELLLLTFSRRAAQDMLRRAALVSGQSFAKVEGGTFHAVASRILRKHGWHVGIKSNFVVISCADAESIIQQVRPFCSVKGRQPNARQILSVLSASVSKSIHPAAAAAEKYPKFFEFADFFNETAQAYAEYKAAHNYLDYDDLLLGWLRLLATGKISGQFQHVLVDEYQDVNYLQADIVRLLVAGHGNLTAVGDEAQGIYSFRGAEISNILNFEQTFSGAAVIRLEQNYRSKQPVLDFANAVIDKGLFTALPGRRLPIIYSSPDELTEARWVFARIRELLASGIPPAEIAVLAAASDTLKPLELELNGIPYEKRGGLKLTDTLHVRDLLAYFRVLANPRDTLAWSVILQHIDHVGPKTAAKVIESLLRHDDPLAALKFFHPAPAWRSGHFDLVRLIRECSSRRPSEIFELVMAYYEPLLRRRHPDHADHRRIIADLYRLQPWAASSSSVRVFVEDMLLEPEPSTDSSAPILSTVHSAKGLEFRTVFVVGLVETRFPRSCSTAAQLDEQRRLFYVAVTRAREQLFLTWPAIICNPDRTPCMAVMSPFLRCIKGQLCRHFDYALFQQTARYVGGSDCGQWSQVPQPASD